jgi:hypothetical protein
MMETEPAPRAEIGSTEITRFNALKHGVLSRYTVLPWEDAAEYRELVAALATEHAPQGPTEEHLVEELAGIFWRKRRLRLAEGATYRRGLEATKSLYGNTAESALVLIDCVGRSEWVGNAIRATDPDTQEEIVDTEQDEAMTRRALEFLCSNRNDGYEAALATLREDTKEWWADVLTSDPEELEEDEQPATADAKGLRRFLEAEVLPLFEKRKTELASRSLIRDQAFGEALDPDKLERLGRYEVHLDRKLERTLAMLLRLKELATAGGRQVIRLAKSPLRCAGRPGLLAYGKGSTTRAFYLH